MRKTGIHVSMQARKAIHGYLYILPWFLGFLYFYVIGVAQTIDFSLSELQILPTGGYSSKPVGLQNFITAFTGHGSFKQIFATSMMDIVIDVPLIIFFSLFMSIVLNRKFHGRWLIRAVFFLPVIMSSGAITEAMNFSASIMAGGVSTASEEFASSDGVSMAYYMELFESLAMPGVILEYLADAIARLSEIISASSVQIIIFIGALQAIPSSLYEVSNIEGATAYETFWKVTLPMVMPHVITCVVYTIVFRFAQSEVIDLAYQTAFTQFNYGLSAAFSIISTVTVSILLIVVVWLIQKKTFYY